MRRRVTALLSTAMVLTAAAVAAVPASASAGAGVSLGGTEEYLFTVQAVDGRTSHLTVTGTEDERFRLTLTGVEPVTQFSDRPFRDSRLISPNALDANWEAWFTGDPPNAVLTYARAGKAPASLVVELTDPSYDRASRTLSFTATREARKHDPAEKGANWQRLTTPAALTDVSLFIDSTPGTCPEIGPSVHREPRLLCGLV